MANDNEGLAQANFSALRSNPYPGRGLVAGLDETSQYLVQVYWIMGRSENSRNRVFKSDAEGRVFTAAVDPSKLRDPSLIIYNAMRDRGRHSIVSNGVQTDHLADNAYLQDPSDLDRALASFKYEPDSPNFTPRITAVSSWYGATPAICMSVLRKSVFDESCDRAAYTYRPYPGFGWCITTYAGDGNPLPSFRGDPLLMSIRGGIEAVAETYWEALDADNRVSLAVKFIELDNRRSDIHIINKYAQL